MAGAALLPLLSWREDAALAQMEADRRQLRRRIKALPKMSNRRVELMARLKELTAQELRLQIEQETRP